MINKKKTKGNFSVKNINENKRSSSYEIIIGKSGEFTKFTFYLQSRIEIIKDVLNNNKSND